METVTVMVKGDQRRWEVAGEGKTCGMACGRIADKLQFVQIFMYIENYSFV